MGGRSPESAWRDERPGPSPLPLAQGLGVAFAVLLALVANGRPIGAGDTRPTERVAASLVSAGDLDLDEYPEVEPPFARQVGPHRVSIYPVASAVMAAPVFAAVGAVAALDENGTALAGKLAASVLSALAAGTLFLGLARRRPLSDARRCALVFALGTSVWSTSQALWQHPAAVLFLSLALLALLRAGEDPVWAGRAGLPLALALASRPAAAALVAVLALSTALRWPRRIPAFAAWAAPVAALQLAYQWAYFGSPLGHGFSGSGARFSEPWGAGQLGLLVSPAKGLFVFTPVALVATLGLARAFARGERWLAGTAAAGVAAHLAFVGRWSEWHGGESFGPRMMTDALPLLALFLPEGFDLVPRLGMLLAAVSVAVQALGAFCYDYRWERLFQRPAPPGHAELWSWPRSPIPFHVGRRVVLLALPGIREGRVFFREHPLVPFSPRGSFVSFREDSLRVDGSEPNLGEVFLERGARPRGGRLQLKGRWDGVFFRVQEGARLRRLEVRVSGRGRGTLYVGERSFWGPRPRFTEYPLQGTFRIRHPYSFSESGGGDVVVTLGRAGGEAEIESVALVSPREPENVIRLP